MFEIILLGILIIVGYKLYQRGVVPLNPDRYVSQADILTHYRYVRLSMPAADGPKEPSLVELAAANPTGLANRLDQCALSYSLSYNHEGTSQHVLTTISRVTPECIVPIVALN